MSVICRLIVFVGAALVSVGCALTNKADPLTLRYFAPPYQELETAQPASTTPPLLVRVNRVEVAEHLTETIAYRRSESEVAYYDTLRWTEPPDVYLDRALDDALFAGTEMRRGITAPAYTVNVELQAFEELKYGQPRARVAVYLAIADEQLVVREQRLIVDVPVTANEGGAEVALVAAFGQALHEIAQAVRQELRSVAAEQREGTSHVTQLSSATTPE